MKTKHNERTLPALELQTKNKTLKEKHFFVIQYKLILRACFYMLI